MCVQERESQISGGAMEVAELQQQLQLTERERESLVEQLERKQEELESEREEKERSQEQLQRERREKEMEREVKESERREKERGQQELVRQTQLYFITMLTVLFESVFLQLFNRRQLAQAQSANQTQQVELVRYYMHGEKVQFRVSSIVLLLMSFELLYFALVIIHL